MLPAITLAAVGVATDSRFVRASMLEVLGQDYIRTARAKGVSSRVVICKHALRNALLPVVTNMALTLPALLTSVIVIETVFTWDGVGYLFTTAVQGPDVSTLQALALMSTSAVVLANLLADLASAWIDPRIRHD